MRHTPCLLAIMIALLFGFLCGSVTMGLVQAEQGTFFDYGNGITSFSDSTGRSGTIYDYGNGMKSYSDSTGAMGSIYDYGNGFQSYSITPGFGSDPC